MLSSCNINKYMNVKNIIVLFQQTQMFKSAKFIYRGFDFLKIVATSALFLVELQEHS